MDLPPRFRRHPRYDEARHTPRFVHNHHLSPLPPSPPRILLPPLPPLLPPRHDGQLPFPSHFSSPPYLPILDSSYIQELDPPRKPYLDRYHAPLIPPPRQENLSFGVIHDYPSRDSIIEDQIFRRGCNNSYAYDLPRTWDREFPCATTEGSFRISEMERRDRYSSSRVSGVEARDMWWKDANADVRRWDNRSRELYCEREVRRCDSGINGGHGRCFDKTIDARRRECVISGGRDLSFDRDNGRIRLDYGINDGTSLQLENRQQEFVKSNLGLHRFSGRLGREGSKREFHRLRKMNRVPNKSALHRIQSGKERRRHIRGKRIMNELSSSSFRGRVKRKFECLETIRKDNQETEQSPVDLSISFKSNSLVAKAILAPSSPVSKEETCFSTRNQKIRKINNMADAGSANSTGPLCPQKELAENFDVSGNGNVTLPNSSEVVAEQVPGFQSGVRCPQIKLPENFNISAKGNVTANYPDSCEVVAEQVPGFQSGMLCPQIELPENFKVSVKGNVTADNPDSSEVVAEQVPGLLSGALCPQIELPENFNVSGKGNVIADNPDSSEIVAEQVPGFLSGVLCPQIELPENLNVSGKGNVTAYNPDSSDVVAEQVPGFQSGGLCPQIELPENFSVSGKGNVTAYNPDSSEVVAEQVPGFQSGVLCPQVEPAENSNVCGKGNVTAYNPDSSEVVAEPVPGFQSGMLCPQVELPENFNISGKGNVTAYKPDSSELVAEQMPGFQSGVLCPHIELLEKFNVSGNEKLTAVKANSLGDNFVENEALKDIHLLVFNTFGSRRRLRPRSKKKKSRNKILGGTRFQLSEDTGEIVNLEASTTSTSDASKLNTASEKVDIGSDSNRPSFSDQKMKDTNLKILSASLHLSDDVSTECPAKGADCASQLGTDEVTVHAGGSCLANENIGHGDAFGFKLHDDSVELHVRKWGSILDLEKNLIDSKDLSTNLVAFRVDNINEQPLQDGLLLLENAFGELPFKCPASVEVEDITGLPRHHESNTRKFLKDKHLPEHHKSCASECENSLWRSADVISNKFFLETATIPEIEGYCSSNSRDAKISVAGAVVDCSSVSLGTATRSNFLSADHKGTVAEADISLVKTVNQSYKNGANLSNKCGCIEGYSESKIKKKRNKKKKARGSQLGISGSNATVPFDKGSSVDVELANLLATDISSVKEADYPGAADISEVNFGLKEGPSVAEDSHLDAVDFSGDGSFPGNVKKRKVVSPRLNFPSCFVDDSIGDCLASNDLKLDHMSLRLTEQQNADQSEETLSAMHAASTDGSENFSIPEMDVTLAYGDNNLHPKDDLAFIRNISSMCADGSEDFATQSGDELVASISDTPSCVSSPEDLLSHTDFHSESEMIFEGFQTSNMPKHSKTSSLGKSIENATSGHLQTITKVPPSLPQKTDAVPSSKNKVTSAVPNIFSGRPAFNFHTSRKFPTTHFAKSRTWHRTDQSSINVTGPTIRPCPLPHSGAPKTPRISQSSYVRKGNSLVRKPSSSGTTAAHTSSSSIHLTSPCIDYLKKNQVKVDIPCIPRIGQVNTSESSQSLSLPLNHTGRSLRSASCHSVESLPVTNSLGSGGPSNSLDALKETVKSSEIPECQTGSGNNSDSLSTLGKENPRKKISYVKRRSNQLIATSDPKDPSTPGVDKSQASSSDGYYKNSKNQLIRVSSESHSRKGDSIATFNSHRLGSQTILPISFGKRQSSKGFAKTYKLSKFPLVWNLNGAQLPNKSSSSLGPRKVWPYLFPWRRSTYRRSSLPTIRMSKVLSVCGRSLKWSKSIERKSKKANEEATRAVAAAEKRKKEEKGTISVLPKSRNHVSRKSVVIVKLCPGERIFRIGSERYKMDPSRRSLQRITEEEEPSPSDVLQSENNLKKSYVPKRLLIGNDEYVRIGTGNQLVRDPKKRIRVLASEKVRWSLRTARLRLARKRKYCQFFTRFGKCNKSDGKCPYIHDSSKIVVCTKFLNGSCTDSDCKLTHKVIPERMPDCSYFLKGSCSNENCPYRHVDVNPESSICKRFLRGYCADGNECRKKHTYVCPAFESTGICTRSSICKLHHPKKKTEKNPVSEQRIVRGRYFDGGLIDAAECSMASGEKLSAKGEDDMVFEEGTYPDYISLDISNDDPEMTIL
ncbi:uncharacterized protein [Henckelia pumila]|uniref:uncharacterized protein isoform X3 n=1 Tax=Henckelia pumila TaxID=405737 RepID=UPI003C6EA2C8